MVNLSANKDISDPMTSCLWKGGVPEDASKISSCLDGLHKGVSHSTTHLGFLDRNVGIAASLFWLIYGSVDQRIPRTASKQ